MFHELFHDSDLNERGPPPYRSAAKEVAMGVLEILAGAFLVSVPGLVLADAVDERQNRLE
jgi:hypothetical protein